MLDVAVIQEAAAGEASLDPIRARILATPAEPGSAAMPGRPTGAAPTGGQLPPEGAGAHAEPTDPPPLDGEVVWSDDERIEVRTADGISTLLGFAGTALMSHHLCGPDPDGAEAARQQWLAGLPPGRPAPTPHQGAAASRVVEAAPSNRKPHTRNP
ncbi:hypothetical protein [Streptomyces mirabilis]|uniref:hypothetical protein n=1 Tax=Streptomyces mirabilis TaxID=68239 RepID=UPI0036DB74D9